MQNMNFVSDFTAKVRKLGNLLDFIKILKATISYNPCDTLIFLHLLAKIARVDSINFMIFLGF